MTDEERQKLCARLRTEGTGTYQAADEIERLAADVEHWKMIANRAYIDTKPLTRSDAEPASCRQALKDAKGYIEASIFNVPSKAKTDGVLSEIDDALAQSDAGPSG